MENSWGVVLHHILTFLHNLLHHSNVIRNIESYQILGNNLRLKV